MSGPARVLLFLVLIACVGFSGYLAYPKLFPQPASQVEGPAQGDPAPEKPQAKLVVLVVFDQMRGDYLAKWAEHFGPGGFERVKKEGVWYSDVHIPYACTSTAPGHASLVTGAPPSVTGIIENEWYDRLEKARVYCCQPTHPFTRVPELPPNAGKPGRGADTGFSPERLLAETVGDKLKAATNGKGRVVSLSIKDRTAVLMGGKKPDAVYCFDTRDGIFHTGEFYRERVHPWVAEFNRAKLVDSWFEKNWERSRPEIDYAKVVGQPDDVTGESSGFNGQGRVFPHPFRGKLTAPAKGYYQAVECSPAGNELLLELAKKAITNEKLGQGDYTDLLCLSFSSNDLAGHIWGPDSWEMLDITLRSDKLVADLLGFLDEKIGKGKYTLAISADHGICPLPELKKFSSAVRVKIPGRFFELGASLDKVFGSVPNEPMRWFEPADMEEQWRLWPWIYLNHRAIEARGLKVEQVADAVRKLLSEEPFIETAFTRKQLEADSFPPDSFGAKAKLAYHPERCGDVLAIPKPGVVVTMYDDGTNHGTPQPYDGHVPVLAFGVGIPALGERKDKVSSLIVAPILARALGIDSPKDAVEKVPAELTK